MSHPVCLNSPPTSVTASTNHTWKQTECMLWSESQLTAETATFCASGTVASGLSLSGLQKQ